ncbi:MAG: hypothetical protein ACYS0G_08235 [Planctomycetota bacterium]|jgi:hypothetical protein
MEWYSAVTGPLCTAGAALVIVCAAQAETYHVDATADDGGDGLTWNTAFNDLQDALDEAIGGDHDIIKVAQGTYFPTHRTNVQRANSVTFIITRALEIYGGYAGINDPNEPNPEVRDPERFVTILSGELPVPIPPDIIEACEDAEGDCFEPHLGIGCEDPVCCTLVCSEPGYAYCCEVEWDDECADTALSVCPTNAYHVVTGYDLGDDSRLDGVTITGGVADAPLGEPDEFRRGGGMWLYRLDMTGGPDHSPIIVRCKFIGNRALDGGGLYSEVESQPNLPKFFNCQFRDNYAENDGGGVWSGVGSREEWVNCLFAGNWAENGNGGGMFMVEGTDQNFAFCTFADNRADLLSGLGGAMYVKQSEVWIQTRISNCLLWDNLDSNCPTESPCAQIFHDPPPEEDQLIVNFSLLRGWDGTGVGNIEANPLFADDDFRLKSCSPAVDAGDNTPLEQIKDPADLNDDGHTDDDLPLDLDLNDRRVNNPAKPDTGDPNDAGPWVDMGAYEFVPDSCPWDLNGDDFVGINDLLALLAAWGPGPDGPPDFDCDGFVGIGDLLALLANWGNCPGYNGTPPPSLEEEIEEAGLTEEEWDEFMDCLEFGTLEEQVNCACWLAHYLAECPVLHPDCPGDDPLRMH